MKKIFPLWCDEKEIKELKQKAKSEKRSTSNFILTRAMETPNLALGNWWEDPDALRKIIKEYKKKNGKNKN